VTFSSMARSWSMTSWARSSIAYLNTTTQPPPAGGLYVYRKGSTLDWSQAKVRREAKYSPTFRKPSGLR